MVDYAGEHFKIILPFTKRCARHHDFSACALWLLPLTLKVKVAFYFRGWLCRVTCQNQLHLTNSS